MDSLSDTISLTFIISLIIIIYFFYKCSIRNFKYWEERGIPYVKPAPFIGNGWKVVTNQVQIGPYLGKLYNRFNTPYFGIFIFNKPYLVIRDPELIKLMLVKDFQNFYDRIVFSDETIDPIGSKFLLLEKGSKWKYERIRSAPAFSSGRLKSMMMLMNKVVDDLKMYLESNLHKDFIEAKEFAGKFAVDVISTCAFGIEANSFKSEDAEFRKMATLVFGVGWRTHIAQTFSYLMPSVIKIFKMPFFDQVFTDFMKRVFWEVFNDREKHPQKRNDVIDIILQLKQNSEVHKKYKYDGDRMIATAGQFFAGFEGISSIIALTLHELCLQPDIQSRLHNEIKSVLSQHETLTYEALKEMTYLDMVINESLRKYPTLPFLDRICIEDYRVPDIDYVIKKGTPIFIPIFGLHYDPQYFPDPEKFDPERFSASNKDNFPEYAFIPFGKGPRSCIGGRFGFISVKFGLAHILSEYIVVRSTATRSPLEFETKGFLLASKYGIPVKFKKIT